MRYDNPLTHSYFVGPVFESCEVWKKGEISSTNQSFGRMHLTLTALPKPSQMQLNYQDQANGLHCLKVSEQGGKPQSWNPCRKQLLRQRKAHPLTPGHKETGLSFNG